MLIPNNLLKICEIGGIFLGRISLRPPADLCQVCRRSGRRVSWASHYRRFEKLDGRWLTALIILGYSGDE
jgi:hypothetical protein